MSAIAALRPWVKRRESVAARCIWACATWARGARMPVIRPLHAVLYAAHRGVRGVAAQAARVLWWTPLFLSRVESKAPGLRLERGMPLVLGPLRISLGRDVRLSGQSTLTARPGGGAAPLLDVGNNVDIGWQTTIAVGTRIVIGNNVRLAGRCFLAGYPGHPVDAANRAAGLPDTEDQIGDVVLEDDVWLATGVTVLAGVRIGRGSIIGAGSVVTRDIPAGVLAAGAPARVLRRLDEGRVSQ
jgi:acetyltransferase-like isoleucine patch superfamily enzyme